MYLRRCYLTRFNFVSGLRRNLKSSRPALRIFGMDLFVDFAMFYGGGGGGGF